MGEPCGLVFSSIPLHSNHNAHVIMHLNHLKMNNKQAEKDCILSVKNLREYAGNDHERLKLQLAYIRSQLEMIEQCLWDEAGQYRLISWCSFIADSCAVHRG